MAEGNLPDEAVVGGSQDLRRHAVHRVPEAKLAVAVGAEEVRLTTCRETLKRLHTHI
jgi:hypothetical protein